MGNSTFSGPIERVDEFCWRIPRSYKPTMRVDGLIFASEELMAHIRGDQAPEQVANVATLPGIQQASLAMPDIHWGYGFSIGGVCATAVPWGANAELYEYFLEYTRARVVVCPPPDRVSGPFQIRKVELPEGPLEFAISPAGSPSDSTQALHSSRGGACSPRAGLAASFRSARFPVKR